MDQELEYRGVRTLIGKERDGRREWTIFPNGLSQESAITGVIVLGGPRGSFKEAVLASRAAIDELIDGEEAAAK